MDGMVGVLVYEDLPVVTLENLIGNLGGILNLWVGLSFITIVEVIELCIKIITTLIKHCKKSTFYRNKVTVADSNN